MQMYDPFAYASELQTDCLISHPGIQISGKHVQMEPGCDQSLNDNREGIMIRNDPLESKAKFKKMSELSDDPPELVSTDEEEEIPVKKMIGPEIPAALKRDSEVAKDLRDYIKREERMKQVSDSLRILIVDPFLFGTDNSAKKHNKAWIAAASQKFGFPQSGECIMHTVLGDENRLAVQLLEKACAEVNDYLSDRKLDTLKMFKISDQIRKDYKDDKLVYVDRYSDERVVEEICMRIIKAFPDEDTLNSPAKFAVLYVLNTWTFFANQKFRFDIDVTKEVDKENLSQTGEGSRVRGNEMFKEQKFDLAIAYYKKAIEDNPHSYVYYGNRAQAYLRLKKFLEAASDGRRAVSLKPDWIKGLYRYAEALFELRIFDEAWDINKRAAKVLEQSGENAKDRDKVKKQSERISKMMAEDEENEVEPISNKILEKKKEENSKIKKTIENVKNTADKGQKKKKVEIESDDDIPALASAESSSEDDDVMILDRASEMKLNDELKSSKPRDHEEFRMHELMEKKKRTEKILVEGKKKKEAVRREKIQEETIRKEKEKERELAEANKKVEPEKKKGPLKTGTCAKPVKLEKSTRVNGTDALQSIKKKDIEKLKNMMGMGSQALLALRSRNAIDHYVDALDFVTSKNLTYLSLDIVDVMVLKYAHGVALLEAGTLQRILDGIATFEALLKDYPKQSFPLAYYGIGRGYIKQNRYRDAVEHLDHGLAIVKKKNPNSTVLTWPGSSVEIKETSPPGQMKKSFEDLLYLCHYPPLPDAVCYYTDCHGFYKKEIYFSDPDFQGFVRTVCYAKCTIDFHITCWKKFRTATEDRHSEKDYLERPCFTPDCYACIVKVLIYDKDGLAKKEFTSEVDHRHKEGGKKPKIRQELTNEKRIKRKEEKKALRQQRKMEAQARREEEEKEDDILQQLERRLDERQAEETASVTTEDMDSRSHTTGGGVVEDDPLPKETDMTVLKKELSPGEKYKVIAAKKTKKKKKDKTKTTLSLDEFVGRDNAQEDDDEYDPDKPFSVPSQLRSDIEAFENCHFVTGGGDCSVALTPDEEEIVANLYSYFEDHLRAKGPVYLHDQSLADLMEDFPPEAKDVIRKYESLSNFLLQNLKFAMMDEHLCLLKDSVKAKKMAEEKRRQGTKYQSYSQSVSASSDVPGGPVIYSMGTSLNPSAMEFSPSGTMLNSDSAERTRHGDLCDFELPMAPPRGNTKQRKYSEDEFPTLGDGGMDRSVRSDSVSRASLSDSLSSSCDDMKGELSDSKSGGGNYQKGGGAMEVPPFLSGPPRAAKKMLPQTSNSGSSDKVPPFLSGPPLARNIGGSPRMGSPKLVSPKRASPSSQNMEHKRNIPDEFKRQVLAKLKKEKMDSGNDTPPLAFGKEEDLGVDSSNEMPPFTVGNEAEDLAETYQSDSGNSLDDLDGVDDVVVTATDTQKLDGEDYDANLDADLNKTFEKAVGKGRSAPKTIFDQAPGVSRDPSVYSWNVKEMNNGTKRAAGNNPNIGKQENDSDNLSHKMQLAREAWSTADSTRPGDYCSFPSVHSGPGFGGLPFKIPTSASFPSPTDTNAAQEYSSATGFDDMDDSNIFSEILDSNANGDDKHLDDTSRHSDSFTSDINISAEKEIDQMDEEFVREFSSSVVVGLKSHSAFAEDDNLADLVRSTIEKDLQRCAVSKALNSAMGTHFGRSNSGSTAINRDFLRKPAILCRSIAVQSELLHRGVDHAVQTDPYEPYKLERDALQQQLVELNQMLAQTKSVCHMQRQRYAELKDSYEDAKKHLVSLNSLISENEREKLQLKHDYHNAQEEIRRIKEQLHQSQAQEQSMMMRMNELQQTINNITQQKQEECERMTAERNHHVNIIQQLEANVQQNVATARAAEVELLEFKLDIGMQLMEKHMNDADHYFTNLQAVVKKYEDGNHPIPPQLLRSVAQWQKTKDSIQETAQNCTQSFQEQIKKVKEGTMLASLPKLDLPRAPPPPDPVPSQLLRPPVNIQFHPGQAPGGAGQQQMSPTELRNSPSPTMPLPGPQFQSRSQGPVPQSLPSFAQMPKQPPGMQAGSRPGVPPGGRPSYQGPVPSGNLQQAQALQEQNPTPFTLQPKPTATVNPTGPYASTAKIINGDSRPKMPPGFQGPSAGPPGMGLPSQPPLGGPPGAAQGPPSLVPPKKTAAPKNSFEKIMVNLAKMFPNYKRQQLMGFVQKLRTVRSGSLTGMTLDDIICEVANMILENNPGAVSSVKVGQGGASGLATFNDSGSSSPSSGLSGNQTPISNFEDEDPCIICHEEMTPGTIVSLDCQHIFHDECIRKWLQEQRTCPTCRKYALLADEFPSLG